MVRDPDFKKFIAQLSALSYRERQVTDLACDGLSNKAIANRLGLSEGTVKIHLHKIYKRLGVRSRNALAAALRTAFFDYAQRISRRKTMTVRLRDLNPTLFREFATECMELARSTQSPDRRALFLGMASVWQQMAQRWDEKG
jgi:DNA-binding CsgD family transcriptional regulator